MSGLPEQKKSLVN